MLMKIIKIIVYSNFFVSLCTISLAYRSLVIFNLPVSENISLLIFVGLATFFTYNFQRIVRFKQQPISNHLLVNRLNWMYNNKKYLIIAIIISAIFSVKVIFNLHYYTLLILVFMGFLAIFYVIKIIPFKKKWLSLREVPYVKIFLITIVWGLTTVVMPFFNQDRLPPILSLDFYLILLQQFLFILAITIPFDIRDIDFDVKQNIKTFPILLGKKKAIIFAVILLLVCVGLSFYRWHFFLNAPNHVFLNENIAFLITALLIIPTLNEQRELYYALLIEGTMLLLASSVIIPM